MGDGLVVASNRGPVGWHRDEAGGLAAKRGFGGLVTALGGALQDEPGTWVSVALSDDDRAVAAEHRDEPFDVEADGTTFTLRVLDVGDRYEPYYNEISNRLLWFTVHQLWGEPYEPSGVGWAEPWASYRAVNDAVAEAVVGADGDEVHLQDYHLTTAPLAVRQQQPGVALLTYLHTPWVGASYLRRLPDPIGREVLRGLLAADVVALSSPQWTAAFRDCAVRLLGAAVEADAVVLDGRRTVVADFTLGVDAADLESSAQSDAVARAGADLDARIDGRRLVLRVDRSDLSKNILRGLLAYERLLERHPEHRDGVWHYAHLNPSRQGVEEYRRYLEACQAAADRIQDRFGEGCVTVFVGDDYPKAVAALQRSDVLVANPVMDGTNLVAKEGPALNTRDGVLLLSPTAGAADVMADAALVVNPYDVEAQSEALHTALTMAPEERAARATALDAAARIGSPTEWLAAQRRVLREAVAARL